MSIRPIPKQSICTPWNPSARRLTLEKTQAKMEKNLLKALEEHFHSPITTFRRENNVYCSEDDLILKGRVSYPISLQCTDAAAQSFRPGMEDAHFVLQTDQGTLLAIFDGHSSDGSSGGNLARFVAEYFQNNFFLKLSKNKGNIHQTFEEMIHEVHTQVTSEGGLGLSAGCTAALCYVTPEGKAYTATLGDSEFYVYRQEKVIPLSCVRDFGSRHDAERAAEALGMRTEDFISRSPTSKELRFPLYDQKGIQIRRAGINVSRSIGDKHANFHAKTGSRDLEPLSHKPKITQFQLEPKDMIVGGCDGVWDFLTQRKILSVIQTARPEDCLAEQIKKQSLVKHQKRSCDNVSVITAEVRPTTSMLPVLSSVSADEDTISLKEVVIVE